MASSLSGARSVAARAGSAARRTVRPRAGRPGARERDDVALRDVAARAEERREGGRVGVGDRQLLERRGLPDPRDDAERLLEARAERRLAAARAEVGEVGGERERELV